MGQTASTACASKGALLVVAAANGDLAVSQELLRRNPRAALFHNFKDRSSPLIQAAARGHFELVQLVLETAVMVDGPDKAKRHCIDHVNSKRQSALMVACKHGLNYSTSCHVLLLRSRHPECVDYLVTNGANPLLTDERRHNSCLHFASMYGHSECVHKLLGSRAGFHVQGRPVPIAQIPSHEPAGDGSGPVRFIDQHNGWGLTALHIAVFQGSTTTVRALLRHGAGLDTLIVASCVENSPIRCAVGSNALHVAALTGNIVMAKLILEGQEAVPGLELRGAVNGSGMRPQDYAQRARNPVLVHLLDERLPVALLRQIWMNYSLEQAVPPRHQTLGSMLQKLKLMFDVETIAISRNLAILNADLLAAAEAAPPPAAAPPPLATVSCGGVTAAAAAAAAAGTPRQSGAGRALTSASMPHGAASAKKSGEAALLKLNRRLNDVTALLNTVVLLYENLRGLCHRPDAVAPAAAGGHRPATASAPATSAPSTSSVTAATAALAASLGVAGGAPRAASSLPAAVAAVAAAAATTPSWPGGTPRCQTHEAVLDFILSTLMTPRTVSAILHAAKKLVSCSVQLSAASAAATSESGTPPSTSDADTQHGMALLTTALRAVDTCLHAAAYLTSPASLTAAVEAADAAALAATMDAPIFAAATAAASGTAASATLGSSAATTALAPPAGAVPLTPPTSPGAAALLPLLACAAGRVAGSPGAGDGALAVSSGAGGGAGGGLSPGLPLQVRTLEMTSAAACTSHWSAHLHTLIAQLQWDIGVQRHRRRRQHAQQQAARSAAAAAAATAAAAAEFGAPGAGGGGGGGAAGGAAAAAAPATALAGAAAAAARSAASAAAVLATLGGLDSDSSNIVPRDSDSPRGAAAAPATTTSPTPATTPLRPPALGLPSPVDAQSQTSGSGSALLPRGLPSRSINTSRRGDAVQEALPGSGLGSPARPSAVASFVFHTPTRAGDVSGAAASSLLASPAADEPGTPTSQPLPPLDGLSPASAGQMAGHLLVAGRAVFPSSSSSAAAAAAAAANGVVSPRGLLDLHPGVAMSETSEADSLHRQLLHMDSAGGNGGGGPPRRIASDGLSQGDSMSGTGLFAPDSPQVHGRLRPASFIHTEIVGLMEERAGRVGQPPSAGAVAAAVRAGVSGALPGSGRSGKKDVDGAGGAPSHDESGVASEVSSIWSEDDHDVCSICMDLPVAVLVAGCQHGLCVQCAFQLCVKGRDLPSCPFCRQKIGGFEAKPFTAPVPAAAALSPTGRVVGASGRVVEC